VRNADGSGRPLVLRGHTAPVYHVAFSPDGNRITSVSYDKTVTPDDPRLWTSTHYCLSIERRKELVGVSEAVARTLPEPRCPGSLVGKARGLNPVGGPARTASIVTVWIPRPGAPCAISGIQETVRPFRGYIRPQFYVIPTLQKGAARGWTSRVSRSPSRAWSCSRMKRRAARSRDDPGSCLLE
jgi:hypothetical protein